MNEEMLIANALASPWAMQPEVLTSYAGALMRRLSGRTPDAGERATVAAAPRNRPGAKMGSTSGSIAVLPLYGAIMQHPSWIEMFGGGTSTDTFTAAFRAAMADDSVSQILIDIDSPGGSVFGVGELAAEIFAARAKKPVVAFANSLAASAAYWIGSAASEFYTTPGGQTGSIGVYMAHEDVSQALANAGIKVELISAGRFKTEGNSFEPLGDDARNNMRSMVNEIYGAFVDDVARGRGVSSAKVLGGMGQGRVLGAKGAMAEGMVDGAMSFADVVRKMQGASRRPMPAGRSASALAMARNELDLVAAGATPRQASPRLDRARREIDLMS